MRSAIVALVMSLAFAPLALAQEPAVMTPEFLWELARVSAPVVSPDGAWMVFGVTDYDIEANSGNTDLFIMPTAGGSPRRLTDFGGSEFNAQWTADGARLGFLSARSGSVQLWEIDPAGGPPRQVTDIEGGIGNFLYAPDGKRVSFTRDVKLDQTVNDVYPDLPQADGRIMDTLMYRHWDSWHDFAYSHLFVAEYDNGVVAPPVDVMPGERFDTPLGPFGGVEQINWSPGGNRVAYTAKKLNGTDYTISTNSDIYAYDWNTETTRNLSDGNLGYDTEAVFSPDGNWVVWLSMARDGYESDRNRIFLASTLSIASDQPIQPRELTVDFDQDAHGLVWAPTSDRIFFASETRGTVQLFEVDLQGSTRQITSGFFNYGGLGIAQTDAGMQLIATRTSMSAAAEIYAVDPESGEATQLTFFNRKALASIELGRVEQRQVRATDGAEVLTWVIYPPGFDPEQQYPAVLYAQGGPQSTVSQFFSYRWNFQIMAAHGYVVVAPNRRGVPSFGQEFKEQISGDWGGQAMDDLLAAIDSVAEEPWVDADRLGAVGASFGGYTMYWLAGQHEGRFKTFIAHAGVFNLESMYGVTEEMFFVNFDLGGPYWRDGAAESFARFSPHDHVDRWDTPMLVIHGQRDYRVPVGEGMQAFNALQLKGIESRFLYFPEEGHWILKPQNGILWQRVFFDWLDRYLRP